MNGKRAKALRSEDRPHPGRKHGGTMKAEAVEVNEQVRKRNTIRQALADVFKPKKEQT